MANRDDVTPPAQPGGDDADSFSWEDAQEDLQKQREMIREATRTKEEAPPRPHPAAVPGASPGRRGQGGAAMPPNLEFVLDIPLQVTVELGRTRMLINDLLQLDPGSVIELTKLVGEPLEVLINHKLVARGEVVVVNEKFGIRLTDIISPTERIEQLR